MDFNREAEAEGLEMPGIEVQEDWVVVPGGAAVKHQAAEFGCRLASYIVSNAATLMPSGGGTVLVALPCVRAEADSFYPPRQAEEELVQPKGGIDGKLVKPCRIHEETATCPERMQRLIRRE
jgi:hypothetical protein